MLGRRARERMEERSAQRRELEGARACSFHLRKEAAGNSDAPHVFRRRRRLQTSILLAKNSRGEGVLRKGRQGRAVNKECFLRKGPPRLWSVLLESSRGGDSRENPQINTQKKGSRLRRASFLLDFRSKTPLLRVWLGKEKRNEDGPPPTKKKIPA